MLFRSPTPASNITIKMIVEIEGPLFFFPLFFTAFSSFIGFPTVHYSGRFFCLLTFAGSQSVSTPVFRCSPHTTGRCQPACGIPETEFAVPGKLFLTYLLYAPAAALLMCPHALLGYQKDAGADYQDAACHVEDCGTDAAGGGEERTLLVYNLKCSLI